MDRVEGQAEVRIGRAEIAGALRTGKVFALLVFPIVCLGSELFPFAAAVFVPSLRSLEEAEPLSDHRMHSTLITLLRSELFYSSKADQTPSYVLSPPSLKRPAHPFQRLYRDRNVSLICCTCATVAF